MAEMMTKWNLRFVPIGKALAVEGGDTAKQSRDDRILDLSKEAKILLHDGRRVMDQVRRGQRTLGPGDAQVLRCVVAWPPRDFSGVLDHKRLDREGPAHSCVLRHGGNIMDRNTVGSWVGCDHVHSPSLWGEMRGGDFRLG